MRLFPYVGKYFTVMLVTLVEYVKTAAYGLWLV